MRYEEPGVLSIRLLVFLFFYSIISLILDILDSLLALFLYTSDFVTDCFYTVHLCFICYFSFIPVYIFTICSHVIRMCTFPFILTH